MGSSARVVVAAVAVVLGVLVAAGTARAGGGKAKKPAATASTTTTTATAAQDAAQQRDPLIVLQLEVVDGIIDPAERVRVEDELAMMLGRHQRIEAVTQREVKRMVDLEAARQSSGCDDEGCAAEIGAALGARWLMGGRVERDNGGRIAFSLWLFDAQLAKVVKRGQAKGARYSDVKVQLPFTLDNVIEDLKSPGDPGPGDLIEESRPKLAVLPPRLPHLGDKSTAAIMSAIDEAAGVAAQRLNLAYLDGAAVDEIAKAAHCKSDDARCTLPAAAARGAALGLGVSATAVLARATFLQPDGAVVAIGEREVKRPADLPDAVRGAIYDAAARRLGIAAAAPVTPLASVASPPAPRAGNASNNAGERVVLETPCNLSHGLEARSATCTITTRRLRIDGVDHEDIALADIDNISPVPILGFIPTGVRVAKRNGDSLILIVRDRDRFIRKLGDPQ